MIWTALILGLTSSIHCALMCGPIVLAAKSGNSIWKALLYNFGRAITYATLGGLVGFVVSLESILDYQKEVSIGVGVLLLLLAFRYQWLEKKVNAGLSRNGYFSWLNSMIGKLIKGQSPANKLLLGVFNGLLPCGMVMVALVAALAQQDLLKSSAYMAVFGFGTMPMMLLLDIIGNKVKERVLPWLRGKQPYLIALIAVLFILRGSGLDIPYISPDVSVEQEGVHSTCCHPE